MYKITADKLLDIVDKLNRGHEAINNLERLSSNKYVYLDLKKQMQNLADELVSRYGLKEFTDINERNNKLEAAKREADENWSRKTGH